MNTELFDLEEREMTIEEFDAIEGKHEFSEEYQQKKQAMLKGYEHMLERKHKKYIQKLVAAIALVCVVVPVTVYAAANHSDFFDNMFGNSTKDTLERKTVLIDDGKNGCLVELPLKEYVPVDVEKAEELIGDKVSRQSIVKQIWGHTLTIESVVYSRYGAQIAFTLEREGGVTMLVGDESTNWSKGAYFSEESPYFFYVEGSDRTWGGENIYIDMQKSTEDKLYCYVYAVFCEEGGLKDGAVPCLVVDRKGDISEEDIVSDETEFKGGRIRLSEEAPVPMTAYTSETGGYLEISPISFCLDTDKGLELRSALDPGCLKRIEIRYKDGSNFVILDHDENIDNTGYACGFIQPKFGIAFNRLVDTDAIDCILVNDVEYHLSE